MRKTNFVVRVVMLMTLMFLLAPALSAFAKHATGESPPGKADSS